jgi:hypothetical protein
MNLVLRQNQLAAAAMKKMKRATSKVAAQCGELPSKMSGRVTLVESAARHFREVSDASLITYLELCVRNYPWPPVTHTK